MDFRRLEIFVQVAHAGSFSRAAAELFLTQPTVSQQVVALETELAAVLFERGRRGATMTAAGRSFYPYALRILQVAADGVAAVSNSLVGTVRIGVDPIAGIWLLSPLLRSFQQAHPGVRFQVLQADSRRLREQLLSAQLDIALLGGDGEARGVDQTAIWADELVLVDGNTNRSGGVQARGVAVAELAELPLVLTPPGSNLRRILVEALQQSGVVEKELSAAVEVDSLESALQCVRAGLGVTIAPRMSVQHLPDLLALPIGRPRLTTCTYLARALHAVPTAVEEHLHAYLLAGRKPTA